MQIIIVLLLVIIAVAVAPGIMGLLFGAAFAAYSVLFWIAFIFVPIAIVIVSIVHVIRSNSPEGKAARDKRDYDKALNQVRSGKLNGAKPTLERLADQNFGNAKYELGKLYRQGNGVEQDNLEAARHFQPLADEGHFEAQLELAEILASESVDRQGLILAYGYFLKASHHPSCSKDFDFRIEFLQNKLESVLSTDELLPNASFDERWTATVAAKLISLKEGEVLELVSGTSTVQVLFEKSEFSYLVPIGNSALDVKQFYRLGYEPDAEYAGCLVQRRRYEDRADLQGNVELISNTWRQAFAVSDLRVISTIKF